MITVLAGNESHPLGEHPVAVMLKILTHPRQWRMV